jgi:hypothetical protein
MRLLEKRGLESGDGSIAPDDPLLTTLVEASIRARNCRRQQNAQRIGRIKGNGPALSCVAEAADAR